MPEAAASRKRQIRGSRTLNTINGSGARVGGLSSLIPGAEGLRSPWMSYGACRTQAPESVAEALADQINRTGWNNSRLRVSPIEQAA
jgi:hypothetical protein